ncbi:MAG TPA: SGNH/GDSL hydrolase family protein [bacterium]|nr:SGNH/GDSL hydrolase family protein [bacterium]HQG45218.1 SGNH/GDSL hydrolase family protein [bacterium]HQI48686.1 SGNH/GDSL hydrolase family protein [bacterium]HQJ65005.1 SGNH/GDSL hydrolase family protein [bacterium]
MQKLSSVFFMCALMLVHLSGARAVIEIPANDPNIQYSGRWDFSDPLAPAHSWPGVYLYAEFEGTSIGVKMKDNFCYYNIIIDGADTLVLHPTSGEITTYPVASGLAPGRHSIRIEKRNETTWAKFTFNGFVLDDGKGLLPPPARPERRIEFVGDSYTSASGNLYTKSDKPAEDAPITNINEGFGPITARHFGAEYMMTSRSGYGMVMDWQGSRSGSLPAVFGQTHTFTATPPWDFSQWAPNLVVIGLGLNDYSGFGGWNGAISESNRNLYKTEYHKFVATLRDLYPGVKILAVGPHVEWLQQVIAEIVAEENAAGNADVFYTSYPYYDGGYVYDGHPSVATHHKIAERLIAAINSFDAWSPYDDTRPPVFTKFPDSPQTSYRREITLAFETDTYATVRYSSLDQSWDRMEHTCTITGQRKHAVTLTGDHGQSYLYYFRAADLRGNMMPASFAVAVNFDTTKILLNWKEENYDDAGWKSGAAPIGYGTSSGLRTLCNRVQTVYFRKSFTVADASAVTGLGLLVKGRDGAVVYLNGREIERINMPAEEEISAATSASIALVTNMNKMVVINAAKGLQGLHNGENLFAVEMHAYDYTRGISFDAQLIDNRNTILFKQGSEWKFADAGEEPASQLRNKTSGVRTAEAGWLPERPELLQNYPNPFNPATTITFRLPSAQQVSLRICNVGGAEVAVLAEGRLPAGRHEVHWQAEGVANGLYLVTLQAGDWRAVRKALVLK